MCSPDHFLASVLMQYYSDYEVTAVFLHYPLKIICMHVNVIATIRPIGLQSISN